ncbi:hypothetical protein L1274_004363 [Duganella sp. HSC-15S17]|uniref:Uncharacterized protein n=1 Tax=Duganella violaceipulchra TaxID=2849652 RepID=A0ABT1GNQ3_9BURK|nr:hypothetical protein [Duganella violaceicalia]
MIAAQDQFGQTTMTMTARYVRNRRNKIVEPRPVCMLVLRAGIELLIFSMG